MDESTRAQKRVEAWDALPEEERERLSGNIAQVTEAMGGLCRPVNYALREANERMERMREDMVRRWLDGEEEAPAFEKSGYPLATSDPVAQEQANKSYRRAIERLRVMLGTGKKATYSTVGEALGVGRTQEYNYRGDPATVPQAVAERVCDLLKNDMDALRGQGDSFNTLFGATVEYLLELDEWEPEHVREAYEMADTETRAAVTHTLKMWLKVTIAEEERQRRDVRERIVRDVLKEKLPASVWEV